MGELESFGETREEKKKRKPREKKDSSEKVPVSQKENFEALLAFCGLDSSSSDKIHDAIEERLKDPFKFIPEKDQRGGCRAKFIAELNKLLQTVDLPESPTVNVLGVDMPVFFDREKFKDLQKYCLAINNVLRKDINPLYNKGVLSDKVFEIPFFDTDMCLSYGWLTEGNDIVEYLEPDALANLWNKKIEKRSTEKNKGDLQEIYENAVKFDSSNEPTSIEEFETIIWEEFNQMMEQVKASKDFIDLKYGHLISPDYFIAILSKEVLGDSNLTLKARRFLLNKLLDRGDHNLTLIPSLHDKEASFGIYQTTRGTHDGLASEFGGAADFPLFEECLGFREQTRTMVWLIYSNMRTIEQFTFRSGPKHVRKNREELFRSVGKGELKDFFYKALAIMHNRGLSAYTGAIQAMSKENEEGTYRTFAEFEADLFKHIGGVEYVRGFKH